MRPKKYPKQSSAEIPAAIEEACPEALAQALALGPTVSEAARPAVLSPTAPPNHGSASRIASNSSRP